MLNEYKAAAAGFTFAEGQSAPQRQQEVNVLPASMSGTVHILLAEHNIGHSGLIN